MSSVDKNQTAAQAEESVPAGDERATFEANWRARNPHIPLNSRLRDDGRYGDHLIQKEWEAWQARAARAPADSVQEEAARLDFLIEQRAYVVSDPDACPGYWLHWARPDGSTWVQIGEYPTPRAAIDEARKQEASKEPDGSLPCGH